MPASRDELMAFLEELGIETTTVDHPPVFTVEESRGLRGEIPGGHSKNLFLKDRKGNLFLLVAEEDARVDLKSIHATLGASGRVSFGKPDLLMEVLGVVPGAVTPFAVLNDRERRVSVFLDGALARERVVNFHPLDNAATTSIAADDLVRFLEATGHPPTIVDLDEAPAEAPGGEG